MEILIILGLVIAFLGCSIIGFFTVLKWVFGEKNASPPPKSWEQADVKRRSLQDDFESTGFLLNHLHSKELITDHQYLIARHIIETNTSSPSKLPAKRPVTVELPVVFPLDQPQPGAPEAPAAPPVPKVEAFIKKTQQRAQGKPKPTEEADIVRDVTFVPPRPTGPATPDSAQPTVPAVPVQPPSGPEASVPTAPVPVTPVAASVARQTIAPWDRPDPPAPTPKRTFAEVMAGFMQEKNIRWGELASGILIVGSAIGLVVSLRDQLQNSIPYFSALLFMLITAAMHGAGSYTLRKWNLRHTSRGVLIIALLLIPLNFLSACLMDGAVGERRSLSDPMYWIAVGVAIGEFSGMSWWSSKLLFRRGYLPLVIGIMGMGASTLLINRLDSLHSGSFGRVAMALPLVVFFLVTTVYFYSGQLKRIRWSERTTSRMYTHLGIAFFAVLSGGALIVSRSGDTLHAIVSLTPGLAVLFMMIAWQGFIVWRGTSEKNNSQQMTGLTLYVLGLILTGISVVVAILIPTVLLITATLAAVGIFLIAIVRSFVWLMPFGWLALTCSAVAGLHLALGNFGWDTWTTASQISFALLSGESGMCLLAIGIVAALSTRLPAIGAKAVDFQKDLRQVNAMTSVGLLLAGSLLAVIASIANPQDVFDNMAASSLLGIAATVMFLVTFLKKWPIGNYWAPNLGTVLLAGFLVHAIIWNQTIAGFVSGWTMGTGATWLVAISAFGIVLSLATAVLRSKVHSPESNYRAENGNLVGLMTKIYAGNLESASSFTADFIALHHFGVAALVANSLVVIGAISIVGQQTGFGLLVISLAAISWWLLTWSQHELNEISLFCAGLFKIATAIVPAVFLIEVAAARGWIAGMNDPGHWLIQWVVLCGCSALWNVLNVVSDGKNLARWLFDERPRADHWLLAIAVLAACGFTGFGLAELASREVFVGGQFELPFAVSNYTSWILIGLLASFVGVTFCIFVRPAEHLGQLLIILWFVFWSTASIWYESSISSASAIRWFVPIGGVVAISLIGFRHRFVQAWDQFRTSVGLSAPHRWPEKTTQSLINVGLGGVVGVVIVISTIVISKFVIAGQESFPVAEVRSWLNNLPKEIGYGVPIAITVGMFLIGAINESRRGLALVGSAVFQYFVGLSIVLLFFANDPRLASGRFLNILQSISIGMTAYGFVWFWFRDRIESHPTESDAGQGWLARNGIDGIQLHALINGVMIVSLSVLILIRFFVWPSQSGGWVNTAGGLLGLFALVSFGLMAVTVWYGKLRELSDSTTAAWLGSVLGIALVSMAGSSIDHYANGQAWLAFRTISFGLLVVCGMVGLINVIRVRSITMSLSYRDSVNVLLPMLIPGVLVLLFAIRGALANPAWFGGYIALVGTLIILILLVGMASRQGWLAFVAFAVSLVASYLMIDVDPYNWFQTNEPGWINLSLVLASIISIAWVLFYAWKRRSADSAEIPLSRQFVAMPNLILLVGSIWIFIGTLIETIGTQTQLWILNVFATPLGMVAVGCVVVLSIVSFWNDRGWKGVDSRCILSLGIAILIAIRIAPASFERNIWVLFACAVAVLVWGLSWINRKSLGELARSLGIRRVAASKRLMLVSMPNYVSGVVLVLIPTVVVLMMFTDIRAYRYLMAMIPLILAVGIGCFSNAGRYRVMQLGTLAAVTLGAVLFAWADLTPSEMSNGALDLSVRTLLVLCVAMFVYGGLITRWLREGDSWIQSLRDAAYATCGLALACFGIVLGLEVINFDPELGCGLTVAESTAVITVILGMIYGLISIAVRPERDPFSLSLKGRQGYVYAAQVVGALLVIHLYLSMPWLFQMGIAQYWPYIAMVITFVGVGASTLMARRKLEVVSEPLFMTATILPVFVAILIWLVDSSADASIVMLTIGLAYLMVCYTHQSLLSGVGAVLFANIALWLYYQKFPAYSFFEHPQLWLIPPAISALIAGQVLRKSMTAAQLGLVRYVAVAVIYVSSTSEIFINGIGDQLWPPMVLALFAVAGIMLGIMMQVRAYLYLGSMFLLVSLVTMVSLAHHRFDHVWPWWAFGIGFGLLILVMFGLFEKKKNEIRAITAQLREWDV